MIWVFQNQNLKSFFQLGGDRCGPWKYIWAYENTGFNFKIIVL